MSYDITFHIGLHKTGSTFLQKEVFPKMDVNFLGRGDIAKPFTGKKDLVKNKKNLISDEGLSCSMPFEYVTVRRIDKANEIKKKYPNAKIIVVFRNRSDWIDALYSEYVKMGGFHSFLYWYKNIFEIESSNFEAYKKFLKSLFDSVLILDFKDFTCNNKKFIKKICDFIGVSAPEYNNVKIGRRLKGYEITVLRTINILFKSNMNKNGLLPKRLHPILYAHKKRWNLK